jgi:extracellular factor (EF) 3-hydroxypalmitic acid methyl ester biosynthesis protein
VKAAIGQSSSGHGGATGNVQTEARRAARLRSNRTPMAQAGDQVRASGTHKTIGELEADVVDVSIHGARLSFASSAGQGREVLLGDQIDPLVIRCNGELVYRGVGTVTRAVEHADHVELGVELQQAAVQLDQLYRASTRRSAHQRWSRAQESLLSTSIDAGVRRWATELAGFLETTQRFLDREETDLAAADLATQEATADELLNAVTPDIIARMNASALELRDLAVNIRPGAEAEHRAFVQARLNHYMEAAPFIWRAKHKPLGYAGDYEMMNMLYRDHREGATLFGKALNVWATQQPAARANINRIDYIGAKIKSAVDKAASGRVRIASIGCGPAREVFAFLTAYPELGERLDVALIDQEERAIAHCERTLAPLAARTGARVRVIKESARRLLTDMQIGNALGECDLIYSAGLFDYLPDRSFTALLTILHRALAEGGTLLIGNVATHNPDRAQMEYIVEWFLHHRSPEQLYGLASGLKPEPRSIDVESEPTGLNLFLTIQR